MNNIELEHPTIVSEDEWLVARKAHLEREKIPHTGAEATS